MMDALKHAIGASLSIAPMSIQTKFKELNEILFWKKHFRRTGGKPHSGHYEHFYTSFFGIERSFYAGKRVLDIGCGPLGSLEWADHAFERVGLDPLAEEYLKLGASRHSMRYVRAGSENIPFTDNHFDVVAAFNSLDHVMMLDESIAEAIRVCKPGGDLLIIVEVNHAPTVTEPHRISEAEFLEKFKGCRSEHVQLVGIRSDHNVYRSLREMTPVTDPDGPALLCMRLRREE